VKDRAVLAKLLPKNGKSVCRPTQKCLNVQTVINGVLFRACHPSDFQNDLIVWFFRFFVIASPPAHTTRKSKQATTMKYILLCVLLASIKTVVADQFIYSVKTTATFYWIADDGTL
jgi:hypothetical protein